MSNSSATTLLPFFHECLKRSFHAATVNIVLDIHLINLALICMQMHSQGSHFMRAIKLLRCNRSANSILMSEQNLSPLKAKVSYFLRNVWDLDLSILLRPHTIGLPSPGCHLSFFVVVVVSTARRLNSIQILHSPFPGILISRFETEHFYKNYEMR